MAKISKGHNSIKYVGRVMVLFSAHRLMMVYFHKVS